jgi:hypothetical protein
LPKEWFYFLPTLNPSEIPALKEFIQSDAYRTVSGKRNEIADFIYNRYSFYGSLENIINNKPLSVIAK